MSMMSLRIPKWLDRPHVPNETAQQRLASITLHRIALFILGANLLAAIFIPSDGSDLGVRIFGLFIPLTMLLLQRFWSTHVGFVFWYGVTFALACIEILARGGIMSSGFLIIARLILGSSIAFSQIFTVVVGVAWFVASLAAALAQQFGWWMPQPAYVLTPFGAWWAIAGSTLNFGMRVVVVIDEFRLGQTELRGKLEELRRAEADEERLIAQRDRLFWYLSHELRSPLTRLKLQIRSAQRVAEERWRESIGDCGAQVGKLTRLTEQSLLLAQLRGRLSFPLDEDVDLMACINAIRQRLDERNAGLSSDKSSSFMVESDAPLSIRSSWDLLERGLGPLITVLFENGPVDVVGRDLGEYVELEIVGVEGEIEHQELPISVTRELVRHHDGDLTVERSGARRIAFHLKLKKQPEGTVSDPSPITAVAEQASATHTADLPVELFRYFVSFAAMWGAVWSIYHGLRLGQTGHSMVAAGLTVTVCSLAALWVNRRHGAQRSFLTLYSGAAVVTVPTLVYGGGVLNPTVFVAVSVLLTSVLVFSKRIVFIAVCLVLLLLGGVTLLEVRGLWPSVYEGMDPFANWMILILSGACFGLVLIPAILKQRAVQTTLEKQSAELQQTHERNELIKHRQIAVFGNIIGELASPLKYLRDSLHGLPDSFDDLREECVLLENRLRQMRVISEAGRISPGTRQRIDLIGILKQACNDVNFEFTQTEREAVIKAETQEVAIEGDPELLMSAFHNVMHNALRFTPAETKVEVVIRQTDADFAEVVISDHGAGVASEFLESIFEPFVQADDRGSGAGLGLAIAKEVVSAHGGEIEARNRVEGGLSVHIRLPLAA